MRRVGSVIFVIFIIVVASILLGQKHPIGLGNGVSVTGAVTTGHCASFASATSIQDAGACGTGSGTVTSVTGTANQVDVATGTTTPVISLDSAINFPGTISSAQAGALSQAAATFTGAPITGGSGTTTFPLIYLNTSGASAVTTFSTSGTMLGMNAPSGFVGNLFATYINGVAKFSVDNIGNLTGVNNITGMNNLGANGNVTAGGSGIIGWSGNVFMTAPSSGVVDLQNTAQTSFTRLDFGGTTSSFAALQTSGTTITAGLADGTAGGTFSSSKYATVSNCSSSASPAVCGSAAAGSVAVPTGTNATLVVQTTAVTANSQIFVQSDDTLGTKLSVTCNTTLANLIVEPVISARTGGTSFTITISGTTTTNPVCLSYFIVN